MLILSISYIKIPEIIQETGVMFKECYSPGKSFGDCQIIGEKQTPRTC